MSVKNMVGMMGTALLSSQCCLLQLLLNYLALPCAGFAILTPYRGLFLTLTAAIYLPYVFRFRPGWKKSLLVLILLLFISFSPELVKRHNLASPLHPQLYMLDFDVVGLKCEACAARLRSDLQSLDFVDHVQVDFTLKRVSLALSTLPASDNAGQSDGKDWEKIMLSKLTWKLYQAGQAATGKPYELQNPAFVTLPEPSF